tara:strand:+ start:96 stop:239 length:144 start_codon:yes stop_codon:yes gene_type:complete
MKILEYLKNIFNYSHHRQKAVEQYLSDSLDLVDLENRQKQLARKGIY